MHYNKHQSSGQEKACSGIAQLVVCLSPCQNGLLHCALMINPMAHGPPAQPGPPGPPDHLDHLDHLLHLDHLAHLVHLDYLDRWTTITTLTTLTTLII